MENKEIFLWTEKSVDTDSRRITAAVSSEAIDRDGEIVTAAAMKAAMPKFMENPVILASHTHRTSDGKSPVVGKVVSWRQQGSKTFCEIEFADTTLGREYQSLYAEKYQRAFSIGFSSLKTETRNIGGKSVRVHTEIELYEISAVAVPANPEALSKHAKSRIDFVQQKKVKAADDDFGFELFYGPRSAFPARKDFDNFVSGKSVNLSQDDLDIMNYLKRIGYDFAEALFSSDFDDFEVDSKDAEGDDFFDPGGTEAACEPDYASLFKK